MSEPIFLWPLTAQLTDAHLPRPPDQSADKPTSDVGVVNLLAVIEVTPSRDQPTLSLSTIKDVARWSHIIHLMISFIASTK